MALTKWTCNAQTVRLGNTVRSVFPVSSILYDSTDDSTDDNSMYSWNNGWSLRYCRLFQLCILSLPPENPECTQIGESVWPITCIVPDSIRLHTENPRLNALCIEKNSNLHCIGSSVMDPAPPDSFYVWYRPSFFSFYNHCSRSFWYSIIFPSFSLFPRAFARTLIVTQHCRP